MRFDIKEKMEVLKLNNDNVKPNFHELGRQRGYDYRTAKKYFFQDKQPSHNSSVHKRKSVLDDFKEIIEDKINHGITNIMSIYLFIRDEKGYTGKYSTVRTYASSLKKEKTKKATIRIETTPDISGQVDWKETMTMYNRQGEPITFNLFLFVLVYSRLKFVRLTLDRKQETLFTCLCECFRYIEGIPKEIWFDNMKTVVDHSKSQFTCTVFNSTFYQFSKDMNFLPIACWPFRPQTKGKVESLAKLTERLSVYNYEFDTLCDLNKIVNVFLENINCEKSQATDIAPNERWITEKGELTPLNSHMIESYECNAFWRKVSQESMIVYQGNKYSVPVEYIGKEVIITLHDDYIRIYYNDKLIQNHQLSENKLNYKKEDAIDILKSDIFSHRSDEDIENFIDENMSIYDEIK